MTFALTTDRAAATLANEEDASYARNIYNSHRDVKASGRLAAIQEVSPGQFLVECYTGYGQQYLTWEWFVLKTVAIAAMPQGYRVSVCACAPGFKQEHVDETAKRQAPLKAIGYPVDYATYLKAKASELQGHADSSDPQAEYRVEPWPQAW